MSSKKSKFSYQPIPSTNSMVMAMEKTRSKLHHYIPRFLIKNWADGSGKVWVYNQNTQCIYRSSPRNVFAKNYLYAYQHSLGAEKSDAFEKRFSCEESAVSEIFRRIIVTARKKQILSLDSQETFHCRSFLISLVRRIPESQDRIRDYNGDAFLEAVRRLPDAKSMGLDDPNILYQDKRVLEMKKMVESNVSAVFASGTSPRDRIRSHDYARRTGMHVVSLGNSERGFVLGSHGFSYATERDKDGNYRRSAWFPFAPDIALALTDQPEFVWNSYFEDSEKEDRFTREINKSTLILSKYVVAKDKQLLKNLRR